MKHLERHEGETDSGDLPDRRKTFLKKMCIFLQTPVNDPVLDPLGVLIFLMQPDD